jgi:hypothetical protein
MAVACFAAKMSRIIAIAVSSPIIFKAAGKIFRSNTLFKMAIWRVGSVSGQTRLNFRATRQNLPCTT